MKLTLYRPTKKELKKVAFVTALTVGTVTTAIMTANAFFMNNYLSFQSPIVLRTPVLVHERELISPIVIEAEIEATESAEEVEEVEIKDVSYKPTARLIAHSESRPDIYGAIVEHFGDDSQVVGELLARESSFDPTVVNSIGACGLGQAYPCEKMECELSNDDVKCQLEWVDEYITNRYGTPENALAFHDEKKAECEINNPGKTNCGGWY